MTNEVEDFLAHEVTQQEERMKTLAMRIEELASIDCPLGVCVYDPRMKSMECEIREIQHHKEVIEEALNTVRRHAV